MTLNSTINFFRPVGNESFGERRQQPRAFDQQPLKRPPRYLLACRVAAEGDVIWKEHSLRVFGWFLGENDLGLPLVDVETGDCRDNCNPTAPTKPWWQSVVYLLSLAEIRQLKHLNVHLQSAAHPPLPCVVTPNSPLNRLEAPLSQEPFPNRQTFWLRPDPARVLVRPFRPAIEPRDLNKGEKTRANHIVDRVLGLDPETAGNQLASVLENFAGRHRNLLATFEARADDMEDALVPHTVFTKVQRQLVGAYFLHEYSFEASALFNPSIVAHPDQTSPMVVAGSS
jgi:hypothetical protein